MRLKSLILAACLFLFVVPTMCEASPWLFRLLRMASLANSVSQLNKGDDQLAAPVAIERASIASFKITSKQYSDQDDPHLAVLNELGDAYRVADWADIVNYRDNLDTWMRGVGITTGIFDLRQPELLQVNSLWVLHNGNRRWQGKRTFFITRFEQGMPTGYDYLAHDNLGQTQLCLGSFYGRNYRILAVKR